MSEDLAEEEFDEEDLVDVEEEFASVFGERIVFTASGLATAFLFGAVVALVVAAALAILGTDGWALEESSPLPTPWLGLIPLPIAIALGWIGMRVARQTYVELDLDGLIVHPVTWSGIGDGEPERARWNIIKGVDVEGAAVTLDRSPLDPFTFSLKPITKVRRELLVRALEGRVGDRVPGDGEED